MHIYTLYTQINKLKHKKETEKKIVFGLIGKMLVSGHNNSFLDN